jgi:benzoyl-CoA reductase/2-hydroxyglutaryl-CoA dehydratase subunit BcrC/BadD/HgdB
MIQKLKSFLEITFETTITDESIEREIRDTNEKNRLMQRFFEYAIPHPPVLCATEMYDVISIAMVLGAEELREVLEPALAILDERIKNGLAFGSKTSPRVLVSGCPINGDSAKVLRIIENAGGVIVALEACSGMKPFMMKIDEGTGDPLAALARAYLTIPCSCMTPNTRRLTSLDGMINKFRPDAIVDVILQACHSYNVESSSVERHIKTKHGLSFLKIETDYSSGDVERIGMRVEALLENCNNRR